jgi:hypothetical protein
MAEVFERQNECSQGTFPMLRAALNASWDTAVWTRVRTRAIANPGARVRDIQGETATIEKALESLDVNGFIVLSGGKIVSEEYFHGMAPETPHAIYSSRLSQQLCLLCSMTVPFASQITSIRMCPS